MPIESYIPLVRQFSEVSINQEDAENDEILLAWDHIEPKSWDDIDQEFRCVILAEAGAGKTEEFRQHASELAGQGKPAFFIRIEDIEVDFYNAFEIGEQDQFQSWLQSTEEAWFFLDSVDEARLENPRNFEKAIRRFAKGISRGVHRAHIYLSSRPYAWRPKEDRRLLDTVLFFMAPAQEGEEEVQHTEPQSALMIYTMRHLDKERIRCFCEARSAKDVDHLLQETERANLWSLAERPFDLEGMLAKWDEDNALGGRLELLQHNIDKRLRDDHNTDRAQRQPLNLEQARDGARRLAAAVVLTDQTSLNVPESDPVKPGINAESILADWDPKDVYTLLERGIFNDIIYGAVRFRHREIRELLAAEWFDGLLKSGNSRYAIESLFFREQYEEKIVTPRLRPILPWLILLDDEIRCRALKIHPEIAVEGGEPSQLPLFERKIILVDIVRRIVLDEDDRSARDNSAIAKIANLDLSEDTRLLINEYTDNDDAIFFLGRLVWQGEMVSCVDPFIAIAVDSSRGIYARRASARAVMTCGSAEQKQSLWKNLNESDAQIPIELLEELVEEVDPEKDNIEHLVNLLGKLPPYEQFKVSILDESLHQFVERLPVVDNQQAISQLIDGFHNYLKRSPYIERSECRVSEEYAWLLGPAINAVGRLIEACSSVAVGNTALSILLMVPAVRYWSEIELRESRGKLQVLVPSWPELNDALYWASIEQARAAKMKQSRESLTDDRSISWLGHFWSFDTDSLPRLLDYMRSQKLQDDRLIALSTAIRVNIRADRPIHILNMLQDAVSNELVLQEQLDKQLNPPVSKTMQQHDKEHAEFLRKKDEKIEQNKQAREAWIEELKGNPERVHNPPNLMSDEWTEDQRALLFKLLGNGLTTNRSDGANWQALIPEFGKAVAQAYRDAAAKYWRCYSPSLRSEGDLYNGIPHQLYFAMAGLEIEATENPEFPSCLDETQVCHALRYISWEINGFPSWFEHMSQTFPALVKEAVIKELHWELENTGSDEEMNYILHDLAFCAPWLHASIAPFILEWMEANPIPNNIKRRYCLHILVNGRTDPARLAALASYQIEQTNDSDSIQWWYALRVDCDPARGIPEIEQLLLSLDEDEASSVAQSFLVALMGGRHMRDRRPSIGRFCTAQHLKSLYVLMHRYIRANEDTDHTDGKVYYQKLRDDAQDARDKLFNLLSEIPGKESYLLIKELIQEHPEPDYRLWIAKKAYKRAEQDGDLEPWTTEQVSTFNTKQIMTPVTHRQLFDHTVNRLLDLKNWLEYGNESPWRTWQRAKGETEMRNLIAGWLKLKSRSQYTLAQEPELANSQRMDIWLQNTNVHSPVPIELKLLDKGWSGPELCKRLRNQLVGDYLREESAGCGVMLLVSQKLDQKRRWMINGHKVGLKGLASAIKLYWQEISSKFPGVYVIDVIVIDLATRAQVSIS